MRVIHDAVVIGAGLAGLAAARALARAGAGVVVLERETHVGGRCGTRTFEGVPVDHGAPFLHGRGADFVTAIEAVDGVAVIRDWPRRGDGPGTPCQPDALDPGQTRLVYAEGVGRFSEWLARGLEVRTRTTARALREVPGGLEVALADGGTVQARAVIVTAPVPEALALLDTLQPGPPPVEAARPMLELVRTEPCLVVMARYGAGAAPPPWDVSLPEWGPLQTIVNDTSKRPPGAPLTLVLHGRGAWSRAHADDPPEAWARELLARAAARHGAWIAAPERNATHVWPHARVLRPTELVAAPLWRLPSGGALGLAGDAFAPETGLEGACRSGERIAARLLEVGAARATS
jgi:renalase